MRLLLACALLLAVASAAKLRAEDPNADLVPPPTDDLKNVSQSGVNFANPQVTLYQQIPVEIRKLENKNFANGPLYTLGEKIQRYTALMDNATKEIDAMERTVEFHMLRGNVTKKFLFSQLNRARRLAFRLHLIDTTLQSAAPQLLEKQLRTNMSQNTSVTTPEDVLSYELRSYTRTAADDEKNRVNAVLQEAAQRLAATFAQLYKNVQLVGLRNGINVTIDASPLPEHQTKMDELQVIIKKVDDDIATQSRLAARSLQLAIRARQAQISEYNNIVKLRGVETEDLAKVNKAQALYDNVRAEYDKHVAAMTSGAIA